MAMLTTVSYVSRMISSLSKSLLRLVGAEYHNICHCTTHRTSVCTSAFLEHTEKLWYPLAILVEDLPCTVDGLSSSS